MAMTEKQILQLEERAEEVVLERVKAITEAGKVGRATLTAEDYAFLLSWLQFRASTYEEEYDDYGDEDDEDDEE